MNIKEKAYKFNAAGLGLVVNHWLDNNGQKLNDDNFEQAVQECYEQYKYVQELFLKVEFKLADDKKRVVEAAEKQNASTVFEG